jgi:myo-inositol-1(or 4)-monophosphatase
MCLVAEGRFDAMLTLRPTWEWDIAAGALIVTEALGRATDRTGNALRFNNPHPQVNGVVAGGGLHGSLVSQLRSDNA